MTLNVRQYRRAVNIKLIKSNAKYLHCNGLGCKRTKKQGLTYFYTILKNDNF